MKGSGTSRGEETFCLSNVLLQLNKRQDAAHNLSHVLHSCLHISIMLDSIRSESNLSSSATSKKKVASGFCVTLKNVEHRHGGDLKFKTASEREEKKAARELRDAKEFYFTFC